MPELDLDQLTMSSQQQYGLLKLKVSRHQHKDVIVQSRYPKHLMVPFMVETSSFITVSIEIEN